MAYHKQHKDVVVDVVDAVAVGISSSVIFDHPPIISSFFKRGAFEYAICRCRECPSIAINTSCMVQPAVLCQYLSCLSPYLLSPPIPFLAWLYHSYPPSIITCCIIAYEYATITNLPPPFDDTTWNLTHRCHGMVDNCCDALETGAFHLACWLSWIILFWPTSHFKYDYRTPLIKLIWAGGASRLHLHSLFLAQYGLRLGKYHRQATKLT